MYCMDVSTHPEWNTNHQTPQHLPSGPGTKVFYFALNLISSCLASFAKSRRLRPLFQTPWHPTSPRQPLLPTHFTKSMSKNARFSRSQDSMFLSFWKCTVKAVRSSQRKTVNKL